MTSLRTALGISVDPTLLRKGIRLYKYSSPPLSICERLFLNAFWDAVASRFPLWGAPNVITLLGGSFILVGSLLLFVSSPHLDGTAPSWVYFAVAAFLFLYQTCDGSDGKQARRTGAGSPLGHLFDHGLDCVVATLVATWAVDIFGQGDNNILFPAIVSLGQLAFFLSNLVCVHKGYQLFYPVDVQEFLLAMMVALILKGCFGADMLETVIGPEGYSKPLWMWIALLSVCSFLNNTIRYCWNTLLPYTKGTSPSGRRVSTAIGHLLAAIVHSALVFLNLRYAQGITHPAYTLTVVSFGGITLSLLVMVVASTPFPVVHWAIMTQFVTLAVQASNPEQATLWPLPQLRPPWVDELSANANWVITGLAVLFYLLYVAQLITIIKLELGIHVFRIKQRPTSTPMANASDDETTDGLSASPRPSMVENRQILPTDVEHGNDEPNVLQEMVQV